MAGALKRAAHACRAPRAPAREAPGSAAVTHCTLFTKAVAPSSVSERERAGVQGAAQRGVCGRGVVVVAAADAVAAVVSAARFL